MGRYYRLTVMMIMSLVLEFTVFQGHASFFVKKAPAAITAAQVVKPEVQHPHTLFHKYYAPEGPEVKNDSYKGILAAVAGSAGIACLIAALFVSSVGLIFPAFLFGVVGIVFGAMGKHTNKKLGHLGLILGILDVALVLLFIIAVIVALASFT